MPPGKATPESIEAEIARSDHADLQTILKKNFADDYKQLIAFLKAMEFTTITKRVADISPEAPGLEAVLTILRDVTSGPMNAVIYELLIAARTDEKLKATLQDELGGYAEKIVLIGMIAGCVYLAARVPTYVQRLQARLPHP